MQLQRARRTLNLVAFRHTMSRSSSFVAFDRNRQRNRVERPNTLNGAVVCKQNILGFYTALMVFSLSRAAACSAAPPSVSFPPVACDWFAVEIHARRSSEMMLSAEWINSEMVLREAFSTSPNEFHQERRFVSPNTARVYLSVLRAMMSANSCHEVTAAANEVMPITQTESW
mmetsp:Transcript_27706/g.81069  ORF Transcript_27706/g.81069 Transcript_27706/m.81069 type:complete len:172 (+) Transcript_27706:8-523(+)